MLFRSMAAARVFLYQRHGCSISFCFLLSVIAECQPPDTKKSEITPNMPPSVIQVLEYTDNGNTTPISGPVFCSLPCPELSILSFGITNVRRKTADSYVHLCDIELKGSLVSASPSLSQHPLENISLSWAEDGQPPAIIPVVPVSKNNLEQLLPLVEGTFDHVLTGIPVTEGNNTFRILAKDDAYGIHGFSFWCASFAFPYSEEELELYGEKNTVETPTVTEGPEFLYGGKGGEATYYCLSSPILKGNHVSLVTDGGKQFELAFDLEIENKPVAALPGSQSPAWFTIRPTTSISSRPPSFKSLGMHILRVANSGNLTDREKFLYGFSLGMYYEGADIVFDQNCVIPGVRLSDDFCGLDIPITISGKKSSALLPISIGHTPEAISLMPNLVWYCTDLFRRNDPMAKEVVLALLMEDLKDIGLEGVSMYDFSSTFMCQFAEIFEAIIEETLNYPPEVQGFHLGRAFGDALRFNLTANRPNLIDGGLKSEFLKSIKQMPYFNPRGRRNIAIKEADGGLMENLKRLFGK